MSRRPTWAATSTSGYKEGVSGDEAKRKRDEKPVEIRKNRRRDSFKKQRDGSLLNDNARLHHLEPKIQADEESSASGRNRRISWESYKIHSSDSSQQLEATTWFRKLLSTDQCLSIDEVVRAGVVPRFVEFLDKDCFPELQIEAAWALANIASGRLDHVQHIIQLGSIPKFVRLLGSSDADILEQVKPALPALCRLIYSEDEEVLIHACWALSFISDGSEEAIQFVIEAGVCERLIELLEHSSPVVLVPTLQTLGNIVAGTDAQTQFVIDNQGLPPLYEILAKNCKRSVKKEACWVISNITAGNGSQIQAVCEAHIIPPVVSLLQHAKFEIKKEAARAISFAISGGSHEQIRYLVSQGCIKPLCDLLSCTDPDIISVCLDGLESILESGKMNKELGIYRDMVEECEGLDKIEHLLNHENNEIYEQAVKILGKYLKREENEGGADMGYNIGRLSLS